MCVVNVTYTFRKRKNYSSRTCTLKLFVDWMWCYFPCFLFLTCSDLFWSPLAHRNRLHSGSACRMIQHIWQTTFMQILPEYLSNVFLVWKVCVCVCVCVSKRERERDRMRVCVCARKGARVRISVCVCVCVCACVCVCVCVCVCECVCVRERERVFLFYLIWLFI